MLHRSIVWRDLRKTGINNGEWNEKGYSLLFQSLFLETNLIFKTPIRCLMLVGMIKKKKKASLKSEICFSSLHAWGLSHFLSAFWGSDDSRCHRQGLQHEYDQLARNRIHNDSYPARWPLLPWGWVSFQGSAEPWVSRSQKPASSLLTPAALPARLGASRGAGTSARLANV